MTGNIHRLRFIAMGLCFMLMAGTDLMAQNVREMGETDTIRPEEQLMRADDKSLKADERRLKADGLLIDAKMQLEIGRRTKAELKLRDIIKQYPTYAAAYYELGEMMLSSGYLDSALILTSKAVELDGKNIWYRLQMTKIYEQQQDAKNLIKSWKEIAKQHPDVLDHYYELSNAYLMAGDGEAAAKTLDMIEQRYGVSEAISLQQKEIWEAIGRPDMAMKEVEQLAKAMPGETKYSAMMAELYMKQRDYKRAKQYYDQVLAADPDDEYIHFSLASYYQIMGDEAASLREMRLGLRQKTMDCSEKMSLIKGYFSEYYRDEASMALVIKKELEMVEQVVEECSEDADMLSLYGFLLMYDDQYGKALEVVKQSLTIDSSAYETWEALLICMDANGQHDEEARSYARRAAALFPIHTLPNYLVGLYAMMDKDYATAKKMLSRCEQMGFKQGYLEAQTYSLLGDCMYALNEHERAWRYYEKSLSIDGDNISTMNNYAYHLAQQGVELEKAARLSKLTIEAEPNSATYLDTYAWVLHKMGRDKEALPYMEKAVKLSDEESETLKEHLKEIKKGAGK